MHQEEVLTLLESIHKQMLNEQIMGFSPDVLAILDNVETSNNEIEMLKFRISQDVLMRVFSFANSAYYGSLSKGSIHTFYEVVSRLGMSHTKALILIIALHLLAQNEEDVEVVFARCFASAMLGKILAEHFGLRDDIAKKVEMGGLFSEIGRMIIITYQKMYAPDDPRIDDVFIDNYHPYLTERLIDEFALPDYLQPMTLHRGLTVEGNTISMSGIVRLSTQFVSASFNQFGNKLVIEPVMLPPGCDQSCSLCHFIEEQFNAVGLGKYLRIERNKERLLPEYKAPGNDTSGIIS